MNETPKKLVLFVCRGNVGRSQIAECLLRKEAGDLFDTASAGTKVGEPGKTLGELGPLVENVMTVLREEGIDASGNLRTQLTEEMAEKADKIILVVDERDPIPDYLLDNPKVVTWDVLDPKNQDLEFTRATRDQIKGLIHKMLAEHLI